MTQPKKMKKVTCCGCFDWLFARRARHSPPEDLDSTVEEIKNVGAEDDAGEQGQGSQALVCLQNAAQPSVVEEELPSDTQDADGVVGKGEMEDNCKRPPTLTIIIHMVKRERVSTPVDETTVAEKDWTPKESRAKRVETLIITLVMVKREKIKEVCEELPSEHQDTAGDAQPDEGVKEELPSEHQDTAGDAQPDEGVKEELPSEHQDTAGDAQPDEGVKEELSFGQEREVASVAVTEPPQKTPLMSCFKKKDAPPNPAEKVVRFNFQNLNTFVKDRELYCGYDYFKYGFPLSMIRSELQELKEKTVKPQKKPAKEAVSKLPEPQQTVTEKATDSDNTNAEPQHLAGILKKGKTASTAHKCLRFDFQNLNTFVKDRELYCGYDYFKYGFPLSSIRSELPEVKERTVKPVNDAVNKHDPLQEQTVREAASTPMDTTVGGKSPKGILKKEKMPRSTTCSKHVRFNLGNHRAPVKERELYRGHDYFRYAAPLQATQSPSFTPRLHQQPVRSASNSLRGAPRHLGRPAQRSNDSFQHNSGRNAAHNYANSRHSQHRQQNSSSHVSTRYETRYFHEGRTNPGTNSRSRRRDKKGAKPSDGGVM